jgi:hypothetical protein
VRVKLYTKRSVLFVQIRRANKITVECGHLPGPSEPFTHARVAAVVEAVGALRSPVPFHGRLQVRTAWPRPEGLKKVAILSRGRERGARWDSTAGPTPAPVWPAPGPLPARAGIA